MVTSKERKEDLIKELHEEFGKLKKSSNLKSSFEDINNIFFIEDAVLMSGFVSPGLSRQICSRIAETYNSWTGFLHELIFPNPHNMINMTESKLFSKEERDEMFALIQKVSELIDVNQLAGLSKDKALEAEFIDGAVTLWNSQFKEKLIVLIKKTREGWKA